MSWQQPNNGAWNVIGKKLNKPETLTNWAVVSFVSGMPLDIVETLANEIASCCQTLGESQTHSAPLCTLIPPFFVHQGMST
jgi:Mid domain of argonaute